jgi:pyruvate formate lyase activating enzyme
MTSGAALAALAEPPSCPHVSEGTTGWVHSWDISTGVDGPGTRLVVFLSGCPLRCLYCHNPDTWRRAAGGQETPASDVERLISRYKPFIAASGGGLTVSGGEPLQQAAFTRRLMQAGRAAGLHTALDTSGFLGRRADTALLDATDLVLLDIKSGTDAGHRRITGRPLGPTLEFARRLADRGDRAWVRYVLVPGYTDQPAELDAFIAIVAGLPNVERVEILPFHTLGQSKYERLGIAFPLAQTPPPSRELVGAVRERMLAGGLPAV